MSVTAYIPCPTRRLAFSLCWRARPCCCRPVSLFPVKGDMRYCAVVHVLARQNLGGDKEGSFAAYKAVAHPRPSSKLITSSQRHGDPELSSNLRAQLVRGSRLVYTKPLPGHQRFWCIGFWLPLFQRNPQPKRFQPRNPAPASYCHSFVTFGPVQAGSTTLRFKAGCAAENALAGNCLAVFALKIL